MRTLLRLLVVAVLGLAVLGFFRGWFSVSNQGRDAGSNKVNVNLTLDPDKVREDAEKVKEKTAELGNQARDKVKSIDR